MSTTAANIAQRALRLLLVEAPEAPLSADEYTDFYSAMNDYMGALEAQGIELGYTNVTDGGDIVTVPPGAIRGIVANVAIEVSPDYGGNVTQELQVQAMKGMKAMLHLGVKMGATSNPNGLPLGSGTYNTLYTNTLFDTISSALITLAGNTLVTTLAVTDTPYVVYGVWSRSATAGLNADLSGRITNTSNKSIDLDAVIDFSATGSSTYTFRLMKAGVSQASTSSALTAAPVALQILKAVTLKPGEYLELWVEDDLAIADVTVTQAQFKVS